MSDNMDDLINAMAGVPADGEGTEMPVDELDAIEGEVATNLTLAFRVLDVAREDFKLTDNEYFALAALLELSTGVTEVKIQDRVIKKDDYESINKLLAYFYKVSSKSAAFPGEICAPIYKYATIIEGKTKKPSKIKPPPTQTTAGGMRGTNTAPKPRYKPRAKPTPPSQPTQMEQDFRNADESEDNIIIDGPGVWVNGKWFPLGES